MPPQAARIAHQLGIEPLPLTAAELRGHLELAEPPDHQDPDSDSAHEPVPAPALVLGGHR